MTCPEFETFLYPYLDGEFGPAERADVEKHLAGCGACAARLHSERAVHDAIRGKVRGLSDSPPAPEALRERIRGGLRAERRRETTAQWSRYAAAAAVVAVAGSSAYWYARPHSRQRYVDDAAARHAKRYPLEIRQPSAGEIQDWFVGKLDHRVPVPVFPNAQLAGARLANVQDKQAAYIAYDAVTPPGATPRRIGLFVYDDKAGDADFTAVPEVGSSHGYNVVSWREGEVVYQLVNDLDESDIRQMLAAERQRPPAEAPAGPMNPLPTLPGVQPAAFHR